MMRAGADMLSFLGLDKHAQAVETSIMQAIVEDRVWTPDLGGNNSTSDVVQCVLKHLREASDVSEG